MAATIGRIALGWFALCFAVSSSADVAVPELRAPVTDLTETLDGPARAALESTLTSFQQQNGAQLAVLIVPSTKPETIEQYAIRVVDAWKLGRAEQDDGVLLLIAKDDRAVRIEVGRGLEGNVPDAVANRIIEEAIVPLFSAGDFAGGILGGVAQILLRIDEQVAQGLVDVPNGTWMTGQTSFDEALPGHRPPPDHELYWILGGFATFAFVLLLIVLSSLARRFLLPVLLAAMFAAVGTVVLMIPVGIFASPEVRDTVFPWLAGALFLVALPLISRARMQFAGGSSSGSSGYSSSDSGTSSWSSSSSSGSSYSGGGGSFGGGGASGSW